jgi:hypothetical protein
MLSAAQLSPPFQFPHPLGEVGVLSLGIEVGIIGGKLLGDTVLVSAGAVVVVVEDLELLIDVDVEDKVDAEVLVPEDPIW